ncbi:ABC transporter ATP-binding protein [Spirochaetia bacterium]|nr:ABC transporter ATP-binding protein [Spirochaetia bacterium]
MPESDMLLQIRDVSNVYVSQAYGIFGKKTENHVLDHITVEIPQGELFGLVGESGCGKTTLARSILGLTDYEGEIVIDGLRQDRKQRKRMARKVQAVFQDLSGSLNPTKRIGWLMEEPLKIHGIKNKQERDRKVDETLSLVGLDPSYKTRKVSELSGGQKQRVCIGCALMLDPKLIIADEAISALDVSVGAQILNLFRDLHARLGLSLVFISHNLNVVYYLCDRIAVMYRGQIVELGAAEDIYSAPVHPYTQALLAAVPELTGDQDPSAYAADFGEENNEGRPGTDTGGHIDGCRFAGRCPQKDNCNSDAKQRLVNIAPAGGAAHYVRCGFGRG